MLDPWGAIIGYLKKAKQKTLYSILLAFPVFSIAMFFPNIPFANWIMLLLTIPILGWFGRDFFIIAYKQAKNKSVNMDTLVALSTGTAFLFSTFNTFFPEFLISKGISRSIAIKLYKLIPEEEQENSLNWLSRQESVEELSDAYNRYLKRKGFLSRD